MSANATWGTAPAKMRPAGGSSSGLFLQKNNNAGLPGGVMPSSAVGSASVFAKPPSGGTKQISKAAAMALFGRGPNNGPLVGPSGVSFPPRNPGTGGTMNSTRTMTNSASVSALAHAMLRENNNRFFPTRLDPIPGEDENNADGPTAKNATFGVGNGASAPTTTTTKLRKETLMSLGISTRARSPKSCMKKSGSNNGMRRASTLSSIHEIDVVLPGSRSITRNTSITFKDTVMVKRVPSSSSLAENPRDLWVQPEEEKQIRQIAKALVQVVDDSDVDPELIDIRGLEGHTRYVRKRIQVRRCIDNFGWKKIVLCTLFGFSCGESLTPVYPSLSLPIGP
jgi:hypothetical protein